MWGPSSAAQVETRLFMAAWPRLFNSWILSVPTIHTNREALRRGRWAGEGTEDSGSMRFKGKVSRFKYVILVLWSCHSVCTFSVCVIRLIRSLLALFRLTNWQSSFHKKDTINIKQSSCLWRRSLLEDWLQFIWDGWLCWGGKRRGKWLVWGQILIIHLRLGYEQQNVRPRFNECRL